MLTGVFKDRSGKDRVASEMARDGAAEQALAELLTSRELRGYVLARNCEIGPFTIDQLFPERALIVELAPAPLVAESPSSHRHQARLKFLNGMGYAVFSVAPQELLRYPPKVLAKLRAALEG